MTHKDRRDTFDKQHQHWEGYLSSIPDMFGTGPSEPARVALSAFREAGVGDVLELGGGQGRDTFLFAGAGINVHVLDYAESAIRTIEERAREKALPGAISARVFDVRDPLPFDDGSFDACYAHMLLCMALTGEEIASLVRDVHRVLRPGGTFVYTVRNTDDPDFGRGIHLGEGIYETEGGFIVHFFDRETIEGLAEGFDIVSIEGFEESRRPKRLFRVILKKR